MQDMPEGFDLDALLAPIPGDTPVGVDPREDFSPRSLYFRLRDARADARAGERALDSADPGANEAEVTSKWRTIRELSTTLLAERAKDLEVAAWLTESLVRSNGLAGLTAGARLLAGLAAAFWEQSIYPLPDEDGIVTRVAPITGLNGEGGDGTLIQPLRKLPLFQRPDGSPFALWQYEQSEELSGIADATRRQQRITAGVMLFEDTEKEARAAGSARWAVLQRSATSALEAWVAMGTLLDEKAGADAPPTTRVRDLIAQVLTVAGKYAPLAEAAPEEQAAVATEDGGGAPSGGGTGAVAARAVTREDMLRDLTRIAEFFRRTEPHSPLADTLQEAVRRGRMTWPELLAELVPDYTTRAAILTSLGIKPVNE